MMMMMMMLMSLRIVEAQANGTRRLQHDYGPSTVSSSSSSSEPCWFVLFLHVAKTGGTFDLASLGLRPSRKVHVMQKQQLVELTTGPMPDPSEALNRRFAVEVHGHAHHDGCLQTHWTLPWAHEVGDKYRSAGCGSAVWTLLREPVAHFISLFRWLYFGFRRTNFPEYARRVSATGSLEKWAEGVLAKSAGRRRRLQPAEAEFLRSAERLVSDARNKTFSRDWGRLDDVDKYKIFAVMLAERGTSFSFQSTRLLPLFNPANTKRIPELPAYDPPRHCGNRTAWEPGDLKYLKRGFDVVGLTELRAAAIVSVAKLLGEHVPDDSSLYANDCDVRDNPARDFLRRHKKFGHRRLALRASAKSRRSEGIWFKTSLPPILPRLLRILLDKEIRFYVMARDAHWCAMDGVRDVVSKVTRSCPHPWEYETFHCPKTLLLQ